MYFFISKNLTVEQWLKIIDVCKNEGIRVAELEYRIIKSKILKHSCEICKRIKTKARLVDNYGMKSLIKKRFWKIQKKEMILIIME
ncbi:hypothetical protein STURON_00614 [Spiroplasma turonicum]|uniref:Transposase n=1 Tax=Spiroplasma turonicum TaxID=216946 RepID=A0A0K1P6F0_9MOLU|nr:hypothetical protein STURON_00614 [Spiroplasma turonicum]